MEGAKSSSGFFFTLYRQLTIIAVNEKIESFV